MVKTKTIGTMLRFRAAAEWTTVVGSSGAAVVRASAATATISFTVDASTSNAVSGEGD